MAAADVGVIVPAWNAERTIGAALASVAGQTQLPGSVTVIDDGSSDGTVAAAKAFASTLPLDVIELASNQGVARAREIGIQSLRTPHVALLDSDDLWLPDHLEITAPLLRTGVMVSANGILWRPGRRIEPRPTRRSDRYRLPPSRVARSFGATSCSSVACSPSRTIGEQLAFARGGTARRRGICGFACC